MSEPKLLQREEIEALRDAATCGPWEVNSQERRSFRDYWIETEAGQELASLYLSGGLDESTDYLPAEANARLIASWHDVAATALHAMEEAEKKTIKVDIGALMQALSADPDLGHMLNTLVIGEIAANELAAAHKRAEAAEARIAELEAGLRPFADMAQSYADDHLIYTQLKSCRRAAALLNTTKGVGE